MAADQIDVLAAIRTGAAPSQPEARPTNPDGSVRGMQNFDPLSAIRTDQDAPNIRREDNTLGEEFIAGIGGGIDSLQGSLYGVAALTGRELGINWLENAGMKGAADNFQAAGESGRQAGGFTDIESAGGFFRWTAASLGEAIPSLALAMTGGGIGLKAGQKAVELGVKKSLARSVERRLRKFGFTKEESLVSARDYMLSKTGQNALGRAYAGERSGSLIAEAARKAGRAGALAGAGAVSALPQIGAIDQELLRSGVADPGLTALIGGIAGGALEALPALRLLDKLFPGIDKQVSKQFVKDFAISTGTQAALEGSTEAAQEIIQLAALAYKDPSFDMFSPDAKRRVVDAFAAGALVGAVTGGGAEAIGGIQAGAFSGARKAVPIIGAWSMTARDKVVDAAGRTSDAVEERLPEGFVAADNTLFQEVKGRVFASVQPHIEAAVNSLQTQVDKVTQSLNDNLEGGMNSESASISAIAKAAHNKFLEEHADRIQATKEYLQRQTERIAIAAKELQNPEERSQYITDQVEAVKERLAGFVDMIRRKAAERDQKTEAEVDNMDLDDDMLSQLGIEIEQEETERRTGPSGRKFDRSVGPEVQQESPIVADSREISQTGEAEAIPVLTFGRNQLSPKVGVDGKETVVGYKTKADAQKGRTKLKLKFPNAKNDAFRITRNPDGNGWIIEGIDPTLRDDAKFFSDFDAARDSATRRKNNPRKVRITGVDGAKFGYKFKNLVIDVATMAFKGRNLDPNASTQQEGFLAFAGEMLSRGMINNEQFNQLQEAADKVLGETKNDPIDEFAAPPKFNTRGIATHVMINFKNFLTEKGITVPRDLFAVVKNEDGTFSFGFNQEKPQLFRALKAKNPEQVAQINTLLKEFRRSEQLDNAAQQAGDFSGNAVLSEGGDLGDTRGTTAGPARVASDPVRTGRTGEGKRTATRTKTGQPIPDTNVATSATRDTDPQADDRVTDPQTKPKEFDDRSDPSVRNRKRRAKQNSQELSNRDQKLLKRWGRKGSVKIMLGDAASNTVQALTDLANFVTKTLGLNNQITVMDDAGLRLMIERGLVSDPIFAQTLNDPSVRARNIRINDNSFVYLSNEILSDPTIATLAFGHEMGHHVYRVAWDKLTPEAQARLRKAFETTQGEVKPSPRDAELLKVTDEKLQGWKDFVVREKARIAKLPAEDRRLESQNERLNQTQTGIENVEGARKNATRGTDAQFNEWMADQLAAWIVQPRLPQGPAEAFFAKVGGQIRRLYDFIKGNPRFQLNETFKEFADAVALKGKTTADSKANPYNDAILKAWFRNEGVTMYSWFGDAMLGKDGKPVRAARGAKTTPRTSEVDNMAFDFAPATAEGRKALAKAEKNFPAIAKRAITLRNWVVAAYKMAIAPATSAVRDIAVRVKTANKLVLMFNRGAQGAAKVGGQNYHQSVELMRGQFMDKFTNITKGIEAEIRQNFPGKKNAWVQNRVDLAMETIGKSLIKKDGDPTATFTREEQAIRSLFDDMHRYAIEAGLPVGKVVNYFPRAFNRERLTANKQKILDHLTDGVGMPLAKARNLYNSLIDPNANDGRATQDATETPGFRAMNSRQVQDKFFDQFLDDNTHGVVANYVNQVVKRAEFNRRLGEAMPVTELTAKQAIKEGIWDPKAKMNKILADAKKEGATDEDLVILEKYIDANLGQLGRDSAIAQPGMRRFMSAVMAYQNMRVLLFTVFASLPDLAGPAIRSGDMRGTWKTLKSRIGEMAQQDSGLNDMARALGVVQDAMSDHIMTEYVDNHYMPAKLRKWNDNFFKYTGLNWYTDFTRKYALAVGIDYIENSYNNFVSGATPQIQARGKDMLAELGLSPAEAKSWIASGKPTYDSHAHDMKGPERKAAEALIQFVDESIMRPNASQRPIMASHPGAMLVYHLKGYMYAVHDIILKRIKFNIDESQSPAQYAAAIAPAIAMMLLTAVGLELRELIQYAGSNRKPPTDRMDGWEYTWELAQRSGLTGFAQIGFDFQGAEDRGMSHVAGIGGPALSQAADIISKPSTQTIPKAIPIIGQIPAARSLVRDVIR